MCIFRRIRSVPLGGKKDKSRNVATRELLAMVSRRLLRFLGHVLRWDGLQRDCLLGMVEERRRRKYMDNIKEMVGRERIEVVVEHVMNREFIVAKIKYKWHWSKVWYVWVTLTLCKSTNIKLIIIYNKIVTCRFYE